VSTKNSKVLTLY